MNVSCYISASGFVEYYVTCNKACDFQEAFSFSITLLIERNQEVYKPLTLGSIFQDFSSIKKKIT